MPQSDSSVISIPRPSALHEILAWSEDRPMWQRDALRRIIQTGHIDDAAGQELERMCRAGHGCDESKVPAIVPTPLAKTHLPPDPGSASSVSLVSLGKLQGVNRLPSDQTITFGGGQGLVVIFGKNGSGKSGYARVLKKACRSRGAPPTIRPNAFNPASKASAGAEIVFRVGSTDESVNWTDGGSTDNRLANVFVFDAATARNYIDDDGPATFTPFGLDVLEKLARVCGQIDARIKSAIDAKLSQIVAASSSWRPVATTLAGRLIGGLNANTPTQSVESLASLTEVETKRLDDLNATLKADPKQKAKETRASAARLRAFCVIIRQYLLAISDVETKLNQEAVDKARTTAEVAKTFLTGFFDPSYLSGTGGGVWFTLWQAARNYSAVAYPGQNSPVTDGKCVLCQRDLDDTAAARLTKFDDFSKDQSQQLAASAAAELTRRRSSLENLPGLEPAFAALDADLVILSKDEVDQIATFVVGAVNRLRTIKASMDAVVWTAPIALPLSPVAIFENAASTLEARALLEESAEKPDERLKLTAERDELSARQWLGTVKTAVLAQIVRYREVLALKACQADLHTRAITQKNNELTESLVTSAFCKEFLAEVKTLGLRTLPAQLECTAGTKGQTKFGIRLNGSSHKVNEVASDGEQRCVALAMFLAELSQASHKSTLLFDDPVSSLDHWYREQIAKRLARESKSRQVVVFTHDTVFLHDLGTYANEVAANVTFCNLDWHGSAPGRCYPGLPWDFKSYEDRIDKLRKELTRIDDSWNPQPNQSNIDDIHHAYSFLRSTIECAVEKIVLGDVVFRFRSYIEVKKLSRVVGFSQQEFNELYRLFRRCSDLTEAHFGATGAIVSIPEPTELGKDIDALDALVAAIKLRAAASAKATAASKPTSATAS